MILDYSNALTNAADEHVGVIARIDGLADTPVTIAANGCYRTVGVPDGTRCGRPLLEHSQACCVAVMLTGSETLEPRGEADWNELASTLTYNLGATRRRFLG